MNCPNFYHSRTSTKPQDGSIRAEVQRLVQVCLVVIVIFLFVNAAALAQDLEPRSYSALPTGLNFLATTYSETNGSVSLDPSLPVTGLKAKIKAYDLAYVRTFSLLGRSASFGIVVPSLHGELSGTVFGKDQRMSRTGLSDIRMRLAVNLIGGPAFTPPELKQRIPTTTFGTSIIVIAPTGQYQLSRLINIGSNRWALKPEIGLSQPLGNWFAEAYTGVWVYTDNSNYFNGHERGQSPIYTLQLHGGYNFHPNLWLAVDATYYRGGRTNVDGSEGNDLQSRARVGLTLSAPILPGFSTKLTWSKSLPGQNGGDYQLFGVTLQYFWFDLPGH